jgi:hypothetical protein
MLVPEFPPFMLDVCELVDSLAESPKYVATRIEHEPEAPARSYRNWILQFGKPEGPVLLRPTAVRGTAGVDERLLFWQSDIWVVLRLQPRQDNSQSCGSG